MFFPIASQFPSTVTRKRMRMIFIFRQCTSQIFRIYQFFHCLVTRICVLMGKNLRSAANQTSRLISAARIMFMENDFRSSTNQHRFHRNWFRRQFTDQYLIPCITFIAVLMITGHSAIHCLLDFIADIIMVMTFRNLYFTHDFSILILTAFPMLMPIIFLHTAYQSSDFCLAVIGMHMFCTNQFAAFFDVARLCMCMRFFCFWYNIAAIRMCICRNFRQSTPQSSIFVITVRIMMMDNKICVTANETSISAITSLSMTM